MPLSCQADGGIPIRKQRAEDKDAKKRDRKATSNVLDDVEEEYVKPRRSVGKCVLSSTCHARDECCR